MPAAPGPRAPRAVRPPLLSAALISLFAVHVCYGAFQSATSIAVVALADELGRPGQAGTVIAFFSAASMLGALLYGARSWESPVWKRFYLGLGILALGCSAMLWVTSLPAAAAVMFVAGLAQAPTIVNVNQLIILMTPASRFTEEMTLMSAMWVIGIASSNLIAGHAVDAMGSRSAFLTIVGFAAGALVLGLVALGPVRSASTQPLPEA